MPYKNIVFVKLEKRLLNDHRWFGMSEKSQLFYIKLILACAETYNRVPSDHALLGSLLRLSWKTSTIQNCIKEIQQNFPRLKEGENFYYFEEFETKTNYIRECPSNAQVMPKVGTDKDKDKDKDIDIDIDIDIEENVRTLFISTWSRSYKNLAEMQGAERLVTEFGYEKVKRAFRIAGENDKTSIAYVRGILTNNGVKNGNKPSPRGTVDFNKWENELRIAKGETPNLASDPNGRLLE